MPKVNVTLSVNDDMYLKFKTECIKNKTKYGEQLEKFMSGYSNNQKINDFLTFQEIQNPRLDVPIEEMNDILLGLDSKRAMELLFKLDEWRVRLLKK